MINISSLIAPRPWP